MSRHVARQLASSRADETARTRATSAPLRATKDSLSVRPSRVSSHQLEVLASELTDYDRAVLLFLSEVRLASVLQLARRLWGAQRTTDAKAMAARRTLWRLEAWRVIDRLPRRVGGVRGGSASLIYALGPGGRRLLAGQGFGARRLEAPGERFVAHTLAITELVVRLHEATLAGELDVIETQTEPRCWRGFLGFMATRTVLKPDLFLRVGCGAFEDRWWVEVDLATESSTTLRAKAQRYVAYYRAGEEQSRHGVFPRCIWTVPTDCRGEQVREALSHLPLTAQRLFVVWSYEEVVGRLSAEATA